MNLACLESDSSSEDIGLTINKEYASKYDTWREREELSKCKHT